MAEAGWKGEVLARGNDSTERESGGSNALEAAALTAHPSGTRSSLEHLIGVIEGEVIPRLLLALRGSSRRAGGSADGEEVVEFARLLVTHDVNVAAAYVSEVIGRGVSLDKVYLELLAPAARLLGEWWKQDLRDFTEVTSGLCRMRQLLRGFSPAFQSDAEPVKPGRSLLLAPVPSDQHSFGLIMVAEFFRRDGWEVCESPGGSREELLAQAHSQWFAIIGISVSRETLLDDLPLLISDLRLASANPGVRVMVGGAPFTSHPERAALVGADATAADGRSAALEAGKLVRMLAQRT